MTQMYLKKRDLDQQIQPFTQAIERDPIITQVIDEATMDSK